MKKLLLGSTALVVGGVMAAPAMAADPIKIGVGGYYTFYAMAGNIQSTYAFNGSFTNYKGLDLETFTDLIKSFTGYDENAWSELQPKREKLDGGSNFAKRLITGLAAERYFESSFALLAEFKDCSFENTTRLGCGYDFRLLRQSGGDFMAVEVKGLKETYGSLSLTPKEHKVASALASRFFLFVVKNFRESPYHEIYPNPLAGTLRFSKKERVVVHTSWLANV